MSAHPNNQISSDRVVLVDGYPEYVSAEQATRRECNCQDGVDNIDVMKMKLMVLVAESFPDVISSNDVIIENIGAGSYNRVFGLTILHTFGSGTGCNFLPSKVRPEQYVIRVPHDRSYGGEDLVAQLYQEIAILDVIRPRLSMPVPRILGYDLNFDNPLGVPYILQTRIRGQSLDTIWPRLTDTQRASAVRRVTEITENIALVTSRVPGLISDRNLDNPSETHIEMDQYHVPDSILSDDPGVNYSTGPAKRQTPMAWMIEMCHRWQKSGETAGIFGDEGIWRQIICIIRYLQKRGWLGETFHLVHNDLYPRNIMAHVKNASTIEITGIIDWDMACFAPKFVGLRSPYWAWTDHRAVGEEEGTLRPRYRGDQIIQEAFLDEASDDFARFAFDADAILARQLFKVVTWGMLTKRHRTRAEDVIRRWDLLHPEDGICRFMPRSQEQSRL